MTDNKIHIKFDNFKLQDFIQFFITNGLTIIEHVGEEFPEIRSPNAEIISEKISNSMHAYHFVFPEQPNIFEQDGIHVNRDSSGDFVLL